MENNSEKSEIGPKKVVSINENLENPFTAFLTIAFFYVFSGKILNNLKMDIVEPCPKTPRRKKFREKKFFLHPLKFNIKVDRYKSFYLFQYKNSNTIMPVRIFTTWVCVRIIISGSYIFFI